LMLQFIKAIIFIPILIVGINFYGILGASVAVLINKVIAVIIAQFTFNKLLSIKLSIKDFFTTIKIPLGAALLSYAVTYTVYEYMGELFVVSTVVLVFVYDVFVCYFMKDKFMLEIAKIRNKNNDNEK